MKKIIVVLVLIPNFCFGQLVEVGANLGLVSSFAVVSYTTANPKKPCKMSIGYERGTQFEKYNGIFGALAVTQSNLGRKNNVEIYGGINFGIAEWYDDTLNFANVNYGEIGVHAGMNFNILMGICLNFQFNYNHFIPFDSDPKKTGKVVYQPFGYINPSLGLHYKLLSKKKKKR